MNKIFYWSPYLSNVATIHNVLTSALSLATYNKKFEVSQQFKDDRYKELAIRIIYEVAPHTLPDLERRNYELEIQEKFNDDDKAKWNSKNRILASLETDLSKMMEDENDRIQFKQRVITFLNNESAKWN